MSSKDIIISEIVSSITKQKIEEVKEHQTHYWCSYRFSNIKTFHDIQVIFELGFGFVFHDNPNHFNVVFKIVHYEMFDCRTMNQTTLYNSSWGKFEKFDRPTISILLDKMKENLKTLKFDKFSGMFTEHEITILSYMDFFSDIPSIKIDGEECPVCKDCITNTKTNCGHTLCIPCFQIIKQREDDDGDEIKPCPTCRCHMEYTH